MEPVFSQSNHEVTPRRATDLSRWAFALGVLAFGVMPRAALAGPCKADGEVCQKSRSCCGTSGNNGVCVKAGSAKFGVCCTPSAEVCDGVDNNCNGVVDDGSAQTGCVDTNACTINEACTGGVCVSAPRDCDDSNACTADSCDPGTGCVNAGPVCGDGLCELSCGENATTCAADCIGEDSCIGSSACVGATGQIGDNACNGTGACTFNTGNVGNGSCLGGAACSSNAGDVGGGSCKGLSACRCNTGDVGTNSCNANQACCLNTTDRGDTVCNTPSVCADGDCGGKCP